MESSIFLELSIVLAIAAGVSVLMRILRQPLIVGYILSGMLVGPAALNIIHNRQAFESFSEIGVTLLLFIVGLGLNIAVIRSTGKPILVVFLVNIVFMLLAGFGAAELFGLTQTEGLIAGLGLLFSSTIVIIKSLNDKREQSRLYGQIAVGIILTEDILATITLLFVAAGGIGVSEIGPLALKGLGLAAGLVLVGGYIMPHITKFFAHSQELLFTFALAWAFGVASLFHAAGFSAEVGALFAGVSLASLPYAAEISTRLKPLRDFFLLIFFITLGEQLDYRDFTTALIPALVFSAVAILLKPLSVLIGMGMLGYTKQTSFKTAIHLSNISEFSVILAVLAEQKGLASSQLIHIITLTALITIALSTYLMKYDDELYRLFAKPLQIFERGRPKAERKQKRPYELMLFGYHRGGHEFVMTFRDMHKPYVVIDYNPEVIETLERQHINHIYGDATDYELLEEINAASCHLIVSNLQDYSTNVTLLSYLMEANSEVIFICHASDYDNAARLYQLGASYVMLPRLIGTEHMSNFIRKNGNNKLAFDEYRKHHIITLGKAAIQ